MCGYSQNNIRHFERVNRDVAIGHGKGRVTLDGKCGRNGKCQSIVPKRNCSKGAHRTILRNPSLGTDKCELTNPCLEQTENTIRRYDDLVRSLESTRRKGYSIDNQECILDVFCVAVPIYDHTEKPVAAISIASQASKMDKERLEKFAKLVQNAALNISRRLGYRGESSITSPDAHRPPAGFSPKSRPVPAGVSPCSPYLKQSNSNIPA